jgi:hypothetical protein
MRTVGSRSLCVGARARAARRARPARRGAQGRAGARARARPARAHAFPGGAGRQGRPRERASACGRLTWTPHSLRAAASTRRSVLSETEMSAVLTFTKSVIVAGAVNAVLCCGARASGRDERPAAVFLPPERTAFPSRDRGGGRGFRSCALGPRLARARVACVWTVMSTRTN